MSPEEMSKKKVKGAIAQMVLTRGHVTFAELATITGFEGNLDSWIRHDGVNVHVLMWAGMSREAVDAINELLDDRIIAVSQCSPLVYVMDGKTPKMPVLSTAVVSRKKPFSKLREYWLPLQFDAFRRVTEADRLPIRLGRPVASPNSTSIESTIA